ncbi:hypothetical protein GCM10028806_34290 [Spirosoma terrae]|uniref:Uncharacterized protein n=1 Tax=Spirosoma terrae TaxID=1968276 RepID=A0A6L9L8P8_9BACT|nr:hypothetical protein [Spirosoma terrae]NDU95742.1 hypothetical protein [Spirosoma terrae]
MCNCKSNPLPTLYQPSALVNANPQAPFAQDCLGSAAGRLRSLHILHCLKLSEENQPGTLAALNTSLSHINQYLGFVKSGVDCVYENTVGASRLRQVEDFLLLPLVQAHPCYTAEPALQ